MSENGEAGVRTMEELRSVLDPLLGMDVARDASFGTMIGTIIKG